MAGDQHDLGRFALLEIVDELDAVTVGELEIGEQDVGPHLRQLNARGAQRARFRDGEPLAFHEFGQPFQLFGVVVYEQDVWHRALLLFIFWRAGNRVPYFAMCNASHRKPIILTTNG